MKRSLLLILSTLIINFSFCQDTYFSRIPLSQYYSLPSNPSVVDQNRIHLVILGDGYTTASETNFIGQVIPNAPTFSSSWIAGDSEEFLFDFKNREPYKNYINYFNFYKVFVPSIAAQTAGGSPEEGILHPNNLLNTPPGCEDFDNPLEHSNFITPFKSTLDKYGFHVGLATSDVYESIISYLSPHFGTVTEEGITKLPPNVYVVVIANDANIAGTANIKRRICNVTGNYLRLTKPIGALVSSLYIFPPINTSQTAYVDNNNYDGVAASHEFSHIFGKLQDEYWFECPTTPDFNCTEYHIAPNRWNTDPNANGPSNPQVNPWSHWMGINSIGQFTFQGIVYNNNDCQQIQWSGGNSGGLYRMPRAHLNCFMGSLKASAGLCSVCREAIIERVHNLVNPINNFTPLNVNTLTASSSLVFNLDLTTPNPNTMRVIWELVDGSTVTTLETDYNGASEANVALGGVSGTAGGIPSGVYRWNMNCAAFAGRPAGNYIIRARVYDMTGTAEDAANRWVRHPQHMIDANDATNGNHERKVEWTVYYNGIPGTDLFTSDVPSDLGVEPNTLSDVLWESPDIWVTNAGNQTGTEHENPVYVAAPGVFSYVHVNVKNRGCKVYNPTTDGSAQVSFYWAKAGTALDWPNSWNGTLFTTNLERGNLIGSTAIGTVDIATGATPAVINWDVPNPAPYATFFSANELDHFCVLSRIVAPIDPMTSEINTGLWTVAHNVKENNNIAWKNFTIVEELASYVGNTYTDDKETGTSIIVENPTSQSQTIRLKFEVPTNETGKSIVDEAEVRVILDPALWTKWVNGGQVASNIIVYNASRRQLLLTNETAYLGNIQLNSNDAHTMYVSYNFLTEELTTKTEFKLRAIQMYNTTPNAVIGGETYIIRPDRNRQSFTADAGGDKEIVLGNNYQGIARGISETAIFNWYDVSTGTKLYTGGTFNVTANNVGTKTYKLETIAQSDGYKDYDVVNVTTILGKINSVAPNPANSGTFAINYSVANSVTTAKIKVININTNAFTENTISTGNGTLTLNVSNYANGSYSIVLICDNQPADSELFVVN